MSQPDPQLPTVDEVVRENVAHALTLDRVARALYLVERAAVLELQLGGRDRALEVLEEKVAEALQEHDDELLREWARETAKLDPLERELEIQHRATDLKGKYPAPMKVIKAALAEAGAGGNGKGPAALTGRAMDFPTVEPWAEQVDGEELLDELVDIILRFVVLPCSSADTAALWTLLTYTFDSFFILPLLLFVSPLKRSGKTTALTVLGGLVDRPLLASNITAPAMFRTVDAHHPTLLIDEADTFVKDSPELRGIINSGHTRNTAFVIRTEGDSFEPVRFSTWCPKAIASIGNMPGTIEDRSIHIPMRRRAPRERIDRLRMDRLAAFRPLQQKCRRWADDHAADLALADPDMPHLTSDRAVDNWRALVAIADAAGPRWGARARGAAAELSGVDETDGVAAQLLADLRDIFVERDVDRLTSQQVVDSLTRMEDRPWPEWGRHNDKPITPTQLARLLKPFGVKPKQVRVYDENKKGYLLEDFSDVFGRYLASSTPVQTETPETLLQNGTFQGETEDCRVSGEKPLICRDVSPVSGQNTEERSLSPSKPSKPASDDPPSDQDSLWEDQG